MFFDECDGTWKFNKEGSHPFPSEDIFLVVGMLLGAEVSVSHWWLWNQIPVTLGNLVGGMFFTGLAIYYAHGSATIAPQQVQSVNHASSSLSA